MTQMKPKHILAFLALFLVVLASVQSLVQISWKDATLLGYFQSVWDNVVSLFFALIVAIPVTVIIQKKYEKNGN
jgi:hypothetical protein